MEYNREQRCYEFKSKELELTPFKVYAVPGLMKLAQVNNEVSKRLATILNIQLSELEYRQLDWGWLRTRYESKGKWFR